MLLTDRDPPVKTDGTGLNYGSGVRAALDTSSRDNRATAAYHIKLRHPCCSFSERGCKGVLPTLILLPPPGFFCVCVRCRCLLVACPFQRSEPNRASRQHEPRDTDRERVRAARPMCRLVPSRHCHPAYRHDRRECECVGPYAEYCPNCGSHRPAYPIRGHTTMSHSTAARHTALLIAQVSARTS